VSPVFAVYAVSVGESMKASVRKALEYILFAIVLFFLVQGTRHLIGPHVFIFEK
jgi:hypothetical protein